GGLVFIAFTDNPPSLRGAKRDLAEPFEMFGFENLKLAAKKVYPIAANWKLAIENYQECYHCATAHADYARMHTLMLDPAKRDRVQGKMLDRFEACGLKKSNTISWTPSHGPASRATATAAPLCSKVTRPAAGMASP